MTDASKEEATLLVRHIKANERYEAMRERLNDYIYRLNVRSQSKDVGLLESIAIKTIAEELEIILR
jgi:hypothetical protein